MNEHGLLLRWILLDGALHCGSKLRDQTLCRRAVTSAEPEIFTPFGIEPETLLCARCRTGLAIAKSVDIDFAALKALVASPNGEVGGGKREEIAEYLQSLLDFALEMAEKPQA